VLELGLLEVEDFGHRLSLLALLRNCECEGFIQRQSNELGAVPGLMDFETDVEVLAGKEVSPGALVSKTCSIARLKLLKSSFRVRSLVWRENATWDY
jgi:hypothetical protein